MHKLLLLALCAAVPSLPACASSRDVKATLPPGANTTCPISGHEVSATSYYEHAGKRIYLCCDDCLAGAAKDPDAALAEAYPAK
jgi:hypothetical protein